MTTAAVARVCDPRLSPLTERRYRQGMSLYFAKISSFLKMWSLPRMRSSNPPSEQAAQLVEIDVRIRPASENREPKFLILTHRNHTAERQPLGSTSLVVTLEPLEDILRPNLGQMEKSRVPDDLLQLGHHELHFRKRLVVQVDLDLQELPWEA